MAFCWLAGPEGMDGSSFGIKLSLLCWLSISGPKECSTALVNDSGAVCKGAIGVIQG